MANHAASTIKGAPIMRRNHAKARLAAGESSIGTWLALPSPEAAGFVAQLGFDWLTIDAEHNPIDILTMSRMFSEIASAGVAPMVRIPWNSPENFKRVLDAGAWGIVVPMVNTREEAERAVEATRYHPLGRRSVGGGRHAMNFGTDSKTYYTNANEEILLVIQIEHIEGVENIDEIFSVPGIDACFIGPNDLAASMGIGLGVSLEDDTPQLVEAIQHIREAATRHGIAPGIHCSNAAAVNMRIDQGFQYLAMASELRYLTASLAQALTDLNWSPSERQTLDTESQGDIVRY